MALSFSLAVMLFTTLLLLPMLAQALPYPESKERDLSSSVDASSVLKGLLGDVQTVIFQNDLLKNGTTCPKMSVLFARGTAEPGRFFLLMTRKGKSGMRK